MKTEQLVYLGVKIKSLAAEAKIIRRDENKFERSMRKLSAAQQEERSRRARTMWLGLKEHRRIVVRREARAALLAYGFLRGKPYRSIEAKCHERPDWERVACLALGFGLAIEMPMSSRDRAKKTEDLIKEWRDEHSLLQEAAE